MCVSVASELPADIEAARLCSSKGVQNNRSPASPNPGNTIPPSVLTDRERVCVCVCVLVNVLIERLFSLILVRNDYNHLTISVLLYVLYILILTESHLKVYHQPLLRIYPVMDALIITPPNLLLNLKLLLPPAVSRPCM